MAGTMRHAISGDFGGLTAGHRLTGNRVQSLFVATAGLAYKQVRIYFEFKNTNLTSLPLIMNNE